MIQSKRIEKEIAEKLTVLTYYRLAANYYGGGHYGGYQSGGAKWAGGVSGDGAGFNIDHRRSRQNVRRACHTSLPARAIIERHAEKVGPGIKFGFNPKSQILKISEQFKEGWVAEADERFDLWAQSKACHRSEIMNLYQAQRFYAICQQRDNDQFIRLYYSDRPDLQNPLQFEFIDPGQLDRDSISTSRTYFTEKDGINRNDSGREISYDVRVKLKNGQYEVRNVPARAKKGRIIMTHGFTPEYAGQKRGFSRLAHAVQEFEGWTDFTSSNIMKAINESSIFGYVKPSADAPASDALEDLEKVKAGPMSQAFGSLPTPPPGAQNVTSESLAALGHYKMPESFVRKPGGIFVAALQGGEDLKNFQGTAPAQNYDRFVDSYTSYLSASCGEPIETMLMRFGSNYSASRAALILSWRIAGIWQHEQEVDFLNIIVEAWSSEEIAAGRMSAPGWSDPILRAAWLNGTWHGEPLPNIDPVKTSRADTIDVYELGAKTMDMVARERNGSDGGRNRAKLTREFEEMPIKKAV